MKKDPFHKGIPVALGTALFGSAVPHAQAFRVLDAYAALGGRMIDTANSYAFWHPKGKGGDSEKVIGAWLKRQKRDAFTVITKIGSQAMPPGKDYRYVEGLSPGAIRNAVDKSLARLRVDAIDLLLAHHDDWCTLLAKTWETFTELVTSGKVKRVGISNYMPQRVAALARIVREQSLAPVSAVELQYSLVAPRSGYDFGKGIALDAKMMRTLKRHAPHAILFAYSPLLGGKVFETEEDAPWPKDYDTPRNRAIVKDVRRHARKAGATPSAWVLKRIADQGIIPVTATSSPERLRENLALIVPL